MNLISFLIFSFLLRPFPPPFLIHSLPRTALYGTRCNSSLLISILIPFLALVVSLRGIEFHTSYWRERVHGIDRQEKTDIAFACLSNPFTLLIRSKVVGAEEGKKQEMLEENLPDFACYCFTLDSFTFFFYLKLLTPF